MLVFVGTAVWGFTTTMWIVAAGLAAHGVMDTVHGQLIANPGVPVWWPAFCASFDIGAGAWLAWSIRRR